MNERERWIIYPLLFFALGAALRDKFTQQVTTDRLHAGKIYCEELEVIDSEKPDRIVAKLSSNPPQRGNQNADRYGVFLLIDSEGKELCGVTNNQLQVSRIACNAVTITDPQNANRALALLTSATGVKPDGSSRRLGSLLLTDSDGNEQFGLADDRLSMRQVICEGVAVVNPDNRGEVLAALGSVPVKVNGEVGKSGRLGVLELNHQPFISVRGNPSQQPLDNPPPKNEKKDSGAGSEEPTPANGEPAASPSNEETASPESDAESPETPSAKPETADKNT